MDRKRLSRLVLLAPPLLAAIGLSLEANVAFAQIEQTILLPSEDNPEELVEVAEGNERIEEFFNHAACLCSGNTPEAEFAIEFFLPDVTTIPDGRAIEVWVGDACDDRELQAMDCGDDPFFSFPDRDTLATRQIREFDVARLANPVDPDDRTCEAVEDDTRVWALLDETGDGTYEVSDNIAIGIDLSPPPALESPEARGAEGGFVVEWELPDGRQDDFEHFQVLCSNVDGRTPVLEEDQVDAAEYQTPTTLCGIPAVDEDGNEVTDGTIDALDPRFICGTVNSPAESIRVSDLPNIAEGYRVILVAVDPARNPAVIKFGVVIPEPAQDFWEDYKDAGGGAEGGYCFVATATYGDYDHPHVVVLREFRDRVLAPSAIGRWLIRTYYRLSPPLAEVIAGSAVLRFVSRAALAPIVVAAGLWVYSGALGKLALLFTIGLMVVVWRRRRRNALTEKSDVATRGASSPRSVRAPRRAALAAAISVVIFILASTTSAFAQQEYLDELTDDPVPDVLGGRTAAKWNVEFRFGPFTPDVDSEFSGDSPGPFEKMFGDGLMLMSKMSVDRFLFYPEGQLGISFGLGFFTTGADSFAYERDATGDIVLGDDGKPVLKRDPNTNRLVRLKGERTNFRLFPLNLSAVYRFTAIDDHLGVPLVPYGKLGLAYTVWSVTGPSGSSSEVATTDCPELGGDCDGDIGRGGSLGYEASLGVALRAERLDPDTSVNLRNEMGIEHAGFFVELALSKVDGFGSSTRLSVGDFTWFGGFNFEF